MSNNTNDPSASPSEHVRHVEEQDLALSADQLALLQAGADIGTSAVRQGLINYVKVKPTQIYVPQWRHVNNGWFASIQIETYLHRAGGPGLDIKAWADHVDGVFVMPNLGPDNARVLKHTDAARNDFESYLLKMHNILHHNIYFIPWDGNFNREIYFWIQVFNEGNWLRHEDRPVRWPR
jgi:hypothetical protein